jgi:uncharacterized protein
MSSLYLLHSPSTAEPAPQTYFLPPDKLISGNPEQRLWPQYQDARGHFSAGIWASDIGSWRIHYTEEEFCQILEGVSILTDAQGRQTTLRAGDSFVISRGFIGSWEVVEATRKIYVIHDDGHCP